MSATAPLSAAQEALWYAARLNPGRISYNEAISIRKDGPLDVPALRRAFTQLVRRHAAWRTTFDTDAGQPVQVIHPVPDFDLPVLDLSALPRAAAERRAVAVVADVARVPYDLRRGPLVRPRLIRFAADHHRLYLAMHHIVFDGVSVYRVVLPELARLYDAFAHGREPALPPAAAYADFARWEREWAAGPRVARRMGYWRERLGDVAALPVPHDHPRMEAPRYRGDVVSLAVPAEIVARLRAVAAAGQATLFQALAAAWALLLARHADEDDVVFATAADLRQRPEFEGVVGYALTPLVLRADLAGAATFAELVTQVRNDLLDALDHVVPFERLVRELQPNGGSANPIYQTMLVMEPAIAAADPDWSIHQMEGEIGAAIATTKLDLELELDERPEGHLAARLIYDRDLFDRATAERWTARWLHVLGTVAGDPGLPLAEIDLTGAGERADPAAWPRISVERDPVDLRERLNGRPLPDHPAVAAALSGTDEQVAGAALGLAAELGLGPGDTVLVTPAVLASVPAAALWPPLLAGAELVLAAPGQSVADLARRHRVTLLHAAPDEWGALVAAGLRPRRGAAALASGALAPDVAAAVVAAHRVAWTAYRAPGADVYATLGTVDPRAPANVGRPLAGVRAEVLDRRGRPTPVGVRGTLSIDGKPTGERAHWRDDGTLTLG